MYIREFSYLALYLLQTAGNQRCARGAGVT